MNFLAKCCGTFFGIGYFPIAPGTAATAAGLSVAFFLAPTPQWYWISFIIFVITGVIAAGHIEGQLKEKDPGIVVIDEVVGVMLGVAFLPLTPAILISGFFLFRAFDMFKIYPINKLESLPGGWGIMLDDVMAGIYTNIVLQIAIRTAGLI